MNSNIVRMYPESKSALINWIEQNFHNIQGFVATFQLKDGSTMTIHEVQDIVQASGLGAIAYNAMGRVVSNWSSEE